MVNAEENMIRKVRLFAEKPKQDFMEICLSESGMTVRVISVVLLTLKRLEGGGGQFDLLPPFVVFFKCDF